MASKSSPRHDARSTLTGLFERGEEVVSVFLEELGKNPRLREQLNKTVKRAADAKRQVDRTTQTVLSALNVPSRADYNRLLAKIEALQGSLVNLGMKVDRVLAHQQQTAHPVHAAHPVPAARPMPKPRPRRSKAKAHGARD
jgi:hypothetical protein